MPLAAIDTQTLRSLHREFLEASIHPIMNAAGRNRIDLHRRRGDHPVIITATNSFVTGPIAEAFGVADLIATEPESIDGRYTGRVAGTPCFQHGKIERLHDWLQTSGMNMEGSWFYSDSHNDLPLLEAVTHPVAVDPDPQLRGIATQRGWQITSFRD